MSRSSPDAKGGQAANGAPLFEPGTINRPRNRMYSPHGFLDAIERELKGLRGVHVYAGYGAGASLLLRWGNEDGRILFRASDSAQLVGRQRILDAVDRLHAFKSQPVGAWVFVARGFRPNAARVVETHPIVLVEIDDKTGLATLRGSENLAPELLRRLIEAVEKHGFGVAPDSAMLRVDPLQGAAKLQARSEKERRDPPTAFVSYSWDSDAHRLWVLRLAAELIRNGVEVLIDEWDLADHGNDLHRFMETGIRDADFVIMVCTRNYAERADERRGGVGVESTIITGEFYEPDKATKFIPLVRDASRNANGSLPSYLKSKIFIDFCDDREFERSLEDLLRRIAGRPRYKKPELGAFPDLASNEI